MLGSNRESVPPRAYNLRRLRRRVGTEHCREFRSCVVLGDVVYVDHRRLDALVAHHRLDVAEREDLDGERSEGVAEVMVVPTSAQPRICRCARYADSDEKCLLRATSDGKLSA